VQGNVFDDDEGYDDALDDGDDGATYWHFVVCCVLYFRLISYTKMKYKTSNYLIVLVQYQYSRLYFPSYLAECCKWQLERMPDS